jgi:hypothetical protein
LIFEKYGIRIENDITKLEENIEEIQLFNVGDTFIHKDNYFEELVRLDGIIIIISTV